MPKAMIISCNEIYDISIGRYAEKDVIVYSGRIVKYDFFSYRLDEPEKVTGFIEDQFFNDLPDTSLMFIYAGWQESHKALYFISTLLTRLPDKKKIFMVSCKCRKEKHEKFAASKHLSYIESECGGRETMSQIVKFLLNANKPMDKVL